MKSRFFILSTLALAAIGLVDAQAAQAQESRGARYSFAKNVWKMEQPRVPSEVDTPHAVRQGAMPRSSSFLGVDPGMLSRPAAPQIATQPAINTQQVSHKLFVPNTSFQPSFGKPVQPLQAGAPLPMNVASLPAPVANMPQSAAPTVVKTASAPAHKRSGSPRHHSTAVSGVLKTPHHPTGSSASPATATYGNNVGYVPGGYLPAHSSSGYSANTNVQGRIVHH